MSQTLISKLSLVCQEIVDIKKRQKPLFIGRTNIITKEDEGLTNPNYTQVQDNSNSAKEGSGDEDGLGDTYSSLSGPLLPYNLNWATLYGSGVHHQAINKDQG